MSTKGMGEDPAALDAHFLTSAAALGQAPRDAVPEVAFVGRSNAGKSSTLNRLTGSKRLARVSKTPGRTQLINFFATTGGRLVDLPGFGYAKVSKTRQASWGRAIDDYLTRRENLVGIVLVMDARHPLQPFEVEMLEWCAARGIATLVLLNKADKLKQGPRSACLREVAAALARVECAEVLLFSAQTGMGAPRALDWLRARFDAD